VLRQAYVNANLVRAALQSTQPDIPPLLASLDTVPGSRSVLYERGRWFATSLTVGRDAIPVHLRSQVIGGMPASQRFDLAGSLQMGVGIPIPVVGSAYFEVFSLQELDHTLRILALTLAAGSAAITLAGIVIGRWASGRALRPLGDVAHASTPAWRLSMKPTSPPSPHPSTAWPTGSRSGSSARRASPRT
jgi:hypothetical protein